MCVCECVYVGMCIYVSMRLYVSVGARAYVWVSLSINVLNIIIIYPDTNYGSSCATTGRCAGNLQCLNSKCSCPGTTFYLGAANQCVDSKGNLCCVCVCLSVCWCVSILVCMCMLQCVYMCMLWVSVCISVCVGVGDGVEYMYMWKSVHICIWFGQVVEVYQDICQPLCQNPWDHNGMWKRLRRLEHLTTKSYHINLEYYSSEHSSISFVKMWPSRFFSIYDPF